MTKRIFKIITIIILILIVIAVAANIFINRPEFGKLPQGERKTRIENSPNYREGKFHNLNPTRQITAENGNWGMIYGFLFKKSEKPSPKSDLPSIKTDLLNLQENENILVWFGHSSLFIRLNGVNFLVDPIFSDYASPVPFFNKAFKGSNIYTVKDMPEIDYVIITHDHWDHLDYPTITELKSKTSKIICPLGVGEHLEYWGFDKKDIIETDWNEESPLKNGLDIYCLPARHFSGRSIKPYQSLWASFLIKSPDFKIYLSGDSGYDTHFASIGERFGEIDLALLENGQYDKDWKFIHMLPEETIQAAKDLRAKKVMTIHNSKFVLAKHAWDAPIKFVSENNDGKDFKLITPMIGQKADLNNDNQTFEKWWETTK